MTDARWLEDLLPEYLWAAGFVAGDADAGLFRLARVLDAMTAALADVEAPLLDGTLSSLEALTEAQRAKVVAALQEARLVAVAVPDAFAHALRMYPDAPGRWLADLARLPDDHVDPEIAESYLNRAIAAIADGRGPGATALKATAMRQQMMGGRLHFSAQGAPVGELKRYPRELSDDERASVESFIRASYLSFAATRALDTAASGWPARFWNANWRLYTCRVRAKRDEHDVEAGRERDEEPAGRRESERGKQADTQPGSEHDGQPAVQPEPGERIAELWQRFIEVVQDSDPQLYDPGRHEVLTGLTAHALRVGFAIAAHPGLWVGEFGAPLLRSAAEVVIYLSWFGTTEGRQAEAHQKFKAFGRGRLKLAKLHAEEFADRMGTNEILEEILEGLHEETNREVGEEWQDISLETTFNGKDLRKMALASDTEWLYKMVIAPMSAVLHSEWPMLTRYAMQLCVNPVHRLHWLPRTELTPAVRPVGGEAAVALSRHALDAYIAALAPQPAEQPGPPQA